MISIADFCKVELRVGTVLEAEEVEGSGKLIKLQVDLGEETPRQILAGIKKSYRSEELVGRQIIVVANLEPRMMMGQESSGMMLVADDPDNLIFLTPEKQVSPGIKIS